MKIPFSGLKREYLEIGPEIEAVASGVFRSGWYVLGENVRNFERAFASYLGMKHAVGVASGTEAITLALWVYGVKQGDEVITTDVTAFPTVSAILATGATPVFVDINSTTGLMDLDKVERAITSRTKALVPVHLYGQCVDMRRVMGLARRHNVIVVEDCAQAFGSTQDGKAAGSFGDVAAFSFYPTKNLGCIGDGGAVATDDAEVYKKLLQLRNYGQTDRYHHETFGINSRLDELQAAILLGKLPHVKAWNARRNAIAQYYREHLNTEVVSLLSIMKGNVSNDHLFVVRTTDRERFRGFLHEQGVETLVHYPIPCRAQMVLKNLKQDGEEPRASDHFTEEIVSLPLYPQLSDDQVEYVVSAVNDYRSK